ncbi:hypothetical protein JAAARDRAFT_41990 [Jaapia argillacea MUCL 33604]|uniref:Uncharacterized protein n=1 Tax=Jaapia argillacea MUCL 33604 TaxID=933084 RepID=A0A067P6Z4_9AGAM|nr:hypothetical protein JAAARDRAFT_41990 [Jaapia argillacea MUCL 33604]
MSTSTQNQPRPMHHSQSLPQRRTATQGRRPMTELSTPLRDDFDAYTYNTEVDQWGAIQDQSLHEDDQNHTAVGYMDDEDHRDRYVSYYRSEMGNMFGEDVEMEVTRIKPTHRRTTQQTTPSPARELGTMNRNRSISPRHNPNLGPHPITIPKLNLGSKSSANPSSAQAVQRVPVLPATPPRTNPLNRAFGSGGKGAGNARQTQGAKDNNLEFVTKRVTTRMDGAGKKRFEMVERKILEDGPERTISIWREEVAKSVVGDGDADDRDEVAGTASGSVVDSHVHRRTNALASSLGLGKRPFGGLGSAGPAPTASVGTRGPLGSEIGWDSIKSPILANQSPNTPTTSQQILPLSPSSPPRQTLPTTPSSRTRPRTSSTPQSNAHLTHSRRPSQTNTTTNTRAHTPSQGPRVPSASSVELILATCNPSLLHLAPVLSELGIVREDHLRAVGRMNDETRDREVKEEALRKGVSVVEWAILLDRLQNM